MKSLLKLSLLFFLFSIFGANLAFAQFEGEIRYAIYNPAGQLGEAAGMNLTFTKDRIFVDSNISMNVMAGLNARGVLVRNDLNDFVVLTTDGDGLKVAKSELDGLVNLMNRMQGKPENSQRTPFPWDEKVEETGATRQIQGFNVHEFILKGENPGEKTSVWLTDGIKVNWGLLLDAWHTTGSSQFEHEIPIEMVMNNTSFPLLVEVHEENEVVMRAEAMSVNSRNFDRSKTEIPSDLNIISLTDLMMNFFRQQR